MDPQAPPEPQPNAHNPSTLVYWNDLRADLGLQQCTLATVGWWMWMLSCMAANAQRPGTFTGTPMAMAKLTYCSRSQFMRCLANARSVNPPVCEVEEHEDGTITIINRRMVREWERRRAANVRQARYRDRQAANGGATADGAEPDLAPTREESARLLGDSVAASLPEPQKPLPQRERPKALQESFKRNLWAMFTGFELPEEAFFCDLLAHWPEPVLLVELPKLVRRWRSSPREGPRDAEDVAERIERWMFRYQEHVEAGQAGRKMVRGLAAEIGRGS